MTDVSRPSAITSTSCYSPLSPFGSPSSHPPTPAHLLPAKAPSAELSPAPQRNHKRSSDGQLPQRPPRPIVLARPSQGYPFPFVLTQPPTPSAAPTAPPPRLPSYNTVAARALKGQNIDNWGTPPSSNEQTPAEEAPPVAPSLDSSFSSDSSSSSTFSSVRASSSCSSRASDASSAPLSLKREQAPTADAVAHAHARQKHAGFTPGAPPPAPLLKLDGSADSGPIRSLDDTKKNALATWDHIEAVMEEKEKTPPSLAPSPAPVKRNPLAGGLSGLNMSSSSSPKRESGVGSKVEVD